MRKINNMLLPYAMLAASINDGHWLAPPKVAPFKVVPSGKAKTIKKLRRKKVGNFFAHYEHATDRGER